MGENIGNFEHPRAAVAGLPQAVDGLRNGQKRAQLQAATTTNVTTNVTTVEDIYSVHKRQLCFSKEAILRVDETEASEQNGTFCSFPPLDRVEPAGCWEATVRSSPGSNPSVRPSCSGALPDLLLHHTGDGERANFIDLLYPGRG